MPTHAQPNPLACLEGLTPGEVAEALTQIHSIRPEPGSFETMAEKAYAVLFTRLSVERRAPTEAEVDAVLEELLCTGDEDSGLTV
ncbi:TPA: hypothetical protein QDB15_000059 [Burkholderia vietnamiensis]|uniref:Uncharacterized protein n=1 Tax=Pandoraea apista TaxID=93218 RepID=A0A5E5P147_9BURK|nr:MULTISPECIES: hypothetical protein [Burkholderiaceae]MCA8206333.1 hypothetical protein [Burkholderia vietnamiensis]VVG70396.1 hypothetical protein PAP18089_01356 [Pandoraea apista]HDR8943131.1 hypothetical protein [Burkholderia vietnamiensis]HDR9116335.1 hypothetical protein [Burkholderia vietnamiensis]HDR9205381.1 hypothetical protein [Burkholderia vietnamiensis]